MRNQLVASQAYYQNAVLTLALQPEADPVAAELAASTVLRLKGLQAEEEAHLARIARTGQDPRARGTAAELAGLHSRFAALFHDASQQGGGTDKKRAALESLTTRLQAQELALARVSREYDRHLQVRSFNPDDVRAALAPRAALLELREYRPVNLRTGASKPARWAGLLLTVDKVQVVDLGPVAATAVAAQTLLADVESKVGRQAGLALHEQLLGPLKAELDGLDRLYIAPDGLLHLVPFAALVGPDGRRLIKRLDLRLLQTGRDLRRSDPDRPARGLLALGGIDFDVPTSTRTVSASALPSVPGLVSAVELQNRTAAALAGDFPALPGTAAEVRSIAGLYRRARPDEPIEVWEGANASEARLRARTQPPRVLHLATHGFFRRASAPLDRPMLLSGIALAGANRALHEAGQDGILYAIEAQDLNLGGTELVVLSACETAQGQIDYGEGVSGLVRALRTAGASHVLVTLRPVSDAGATDFMRRFYRHWLGQAHSDPAAAFRAAQIEAMAAAPAGPAGRDQTWAHFVLVGK